MSDPTVNLKVRKGPRVYLAEISYNGGKGNGEEQVLQSFDMRARAGYPYRLVFLEDSGFRQGIIKPLNSAIRQALKDPWCEYVVTLSNDHHAVTDNWLRLMVEKADLDPTIGCLSPAQMNDHSVCGVYGQISQIDGKFHPTDDPYWNDFELEYIDVSRGFCLLRADLLRDIGVFDENFGTGSYENYDMWNRLFLAGKRSVLWGKVVFNHCVHGNEIQVKSDGRTGWWDGDEKGPYFTAKWGLRPGEKPTGQPKFEGLIW